MITIEITEETTSIQDMAYALREIANKIEQGYTRGFGPTYVISGDEVNEE